MISSLLMSCNIGRKQLMNYDNIQKYMKFLFFIYIMFILNSILLYTYSLRIVPLIKRTILKKSRYVDNSDLFICISCSQKN